METTEEKLCKEARIGTMDALIIDRNAPFANIFYLSNTTGESGTIFVWKGMTEEHVLNQYGKLFPIECALHLKHVQDLNAALNHPLGISKERVQAVLGSFPAIIKLCLEYMDPDYFRSDDLDKAKKKLYGFIRKFPRFMVGNHKAGQKYVPRIQHPGLDAFTVADRRAHVRDQRTEEDVSPGDDRQGRDGGTGAAPEESPAQTV